MNKSDSDNCWDWLRSLMLKFVLGIGLEDLSFALTLASSICPRPVLNFLSWSRENVCNNNVHIWLKGWKLASRNLYCIRFCITLYWYSRIIWIKMMITWSSWWFPQNTVQRLRRPNRWFLDFENCFRSWVWFHGFGLGLGLKSLSLALASRNCPHLTSLDTLVRLVGSGKN